MLTVEQATTNTWLLYLYIVCYIFPTRLHRCSTRRTSAVCWQTGSWSYSSIWIRHYSTQPTRTCHRIWRSVEHSSITFFYSIIYFGNKIYYIFSSLDADYQVMYDLFIRDRRFLHAGIVIDLSVHECFYFQNYQMHSSMNKHMMEYLLDNELISKHQHGFISKRSSCSQLLESFQDWISELSHKNAVDVIYLDYSKAFDSISHEKLVHKLSSYGFKHELLSWIKSFLSERLKSVCFDRWSSLSILPSYQWSCSGKSNRSSPLHNIR